MLSPVICVEKHEWGCGSTSPLCWRYSCQIPAQLKVLKEYAATAGFAITREYVDVEPAKQTMIYVANQSISLLDPGSRAACAVGEPCFCVDLRRSLKSTAKLAKRENPPEYLFSLWQYLSLVPVNSRKGPCTRAPQRFRVKKLNRRDSLAERN